jgi:aspartate/methionine/tyrosine aminotransferase
MTSPTKSRILEQHNTNLLLNAPTPSVMPRGLNDLSGDDFSAPLDEQMIASTIEALESGQTHYVEVPGIPPLRAAIADYLRADFATTYEQANVVVTAGIQESRFLTTQMIGEGFNRIGLPSVVHPGVKRALGVRPMKLDFIDVDARMLPGIDAIRGAMESDVRLLFLESPSRLTGAAYTADEVAAISALAGEFDATVIWDQGAAPWGSNYTSLASKAADRTAVIGEAFPGMGLSSWFIGYIAAPEKWVATIQSQKQIMAICTSTPTQYAALEASKLFAANHAALLQRLSQLRQWLTEQVTQIGEVIPGEAANIIALRLSESNKQSLLSRFESAGYAITDGADFGAPDIIRFSVSPGSTAPEAIAQMIKGA